MTSAPEPDSLASRRIVIVGPSPPPYGGMALQGRLLERLLRDEGHEVVYFASNFPLPKPLGAAERVPGIRTLLRFVLCWVKLWRGVGSTEVMHVLAASWSYFFLVVYPAVLIGRLRGKRVLLNYRGGEAGEFFRRLGWAARGVLAWAHVISAPSGFLAGVIQKTFNLPVAIVPNIVETGKFQYRRRTVFGPRILVARHLEKIYDPEGALKAFRSVQKRYPHASLWIAGTGSEEAALRSLVAAWNLENVRFLGHVAHRDMPALCDQCDILLNASRIDNFPGTLIEGSAAGLVLVSTCAGGIPFIYTHSENALLVEPGDWQGLAHAVVNVLESRLLAVHLSENGLKVARRCEWKEVRGLLYQAYAFDRDACPEVPVPVSSARAGKSGY